MREEHGALTPFRVEDSGQSAVTVEARAALGPALTIEFNCDPEPPHGLLGLLVRDAGVEESSGPSGGAESEDQGGGPSEPALNDADLAASLAAMVDSLSRADAFSGAVLLSRGEKTLHRRAYGLADRSAKRANRPETKFNLGSINKIFTHVAILQLAEQGKLRLTDTIDRFLPDYPGEKGSKITIAMLVDHRGGTGDIFREEFDGKRLALKSGADWYAYVRDLPLDFEPGTRQAYSNAGYVLLGAIVESVSGMDYYRYVRERIFEPAGMKSTDSYALAARAADRATGYTKKDGRRNGDLNAGRGASSLHANDGFLPARGSAAGGGYSTVDDLARFVQAMRQGKLLGPEHASRFAGPDGGLGIAGGAPGVNASLELIGPYTLAVLANLDPPAAERLAAKARRLLRSAEGTRRTDAGPRGGTDGERHRPDGDEPLMKPERSFVPPEGVDVSMTMAGHLPTVDVMVNGKGPFRFSIDTGGSGAARVDSAFAVAMGMKVVGEVWGGDPSGRNERRMDVVALDSLSIGGARFAVLHASTRNYNEPGHTRGVDGILGFGLFAGYTVTFDYPGGRLRLDPTELPPVDGKRVLAYTDEDGIPSIHIQVDSLDMVAHVDAGSMGGFILPERMLTRLPLGSEPIVIGRARTVSNTFEIKGAPLRGTLRIGDLEFVDPRLEFQPVMPDANVGSRILREFRLSFDTKNKRIRFARAS
jgi:D-alanyl-D-alanine carboxypeptidase